MYLLTQEIQKERLTPQLVGSSAPGAHISIFLPISDDDNFVSLKGKFRDLMGEAKKLLSQSIGDKEIEEHLKPIEEAFISYRLTGNIKGVAFFRSKDQTYHTPLHVAPPKLVVVADSFHIKPLMQCISSMSQCFAIAVTDRLVKVFHINGKQASQLLTYENEFLDEDISNRQGGPPNQRKRGKDMSENYIRNVCKQISSELNLSHRYVAVLGTKVHRKRMVAELKAKTKAQVFFESAFYSSVEEMGIAVGSEIEGILHEESQRFAKKIANSIHNGMISDSLEEIAEAATQGRIERLVIDPSVHVWGLYDRTNGLVSTHLKQNSDKDDCIIDDIAEQVIGTGGEVVFFDSSSLEQVAPYMATLRW